MSAFMKILGEVGVFVLSSILADVASRAVSSALDETAASNDHMEKALGRWFPSDEGHSLEDAELKRILRLFMDRYSVASAHGEKILSYKDMLFSMCSDLSDLLPKLQGQMRDSTQMMVSFVEQQVTDEDKGRLVADALHLQIVEVIRALEENQKAA